MRLSTSVHRGIFLRGTSPAFALSGLLPCLGWVPVHAQAPLDPPRVVTLMPGVHVLHHPRANETWPQSNTVVIVGDREALVVDATYLPGTTRADIELIREEFLGEATAWGGAAEYRPGGSPG